MSKARQSRLQLHRWLPAALAVALVAAQGSTVAHFALVRHAFCADHGELIHSDDTGVASVHGHASQVPALYGGDERDAHGHGHEHCVVAGQRREALTPARTQAVDVDRSGPSVLLLAEVSEPSAEPRFRLAPKQSPPA